ncbi:transposase, partial [Rhodopirellula baltica]
MDVPKTTTDCLGCKQQQRIIEQQQAVIDALVEQVEKLTKRLEKVEREGKRQAAPFRKGRKADPKKAGRKSGEDHGKHHRRAAPEQIDEAYDVPLPSCCPGCGCD